MLAHPDASPTDGWKLHLNVPRDQSNATAYQLVRLCLEDGVHFKIGRDGDQDGKGMTIYAGTYKDAERIAGKIKALDDKGLLPDLKPAGAEVMKDDLPFGGPSTKVYGRFDTGRMFSLDMHQYGIHGFPFRNDDMAMLIPSPNNFTDPAMREKHKKESWIRSYRILKRQLGEDFTGKPTEQVPEWAKWAFIENNAPYPWQPQPAQPAKNTAVPEWVLSQMKAGLIPAFKK